MQSTISTFGRFVYLNSYAFLLLFAAVGIACIPFWNLSLWCLIPQVILVLYMLASGYHILSAWTDKKRKYTILMERNKKCLRRDTFYEYMQAPCGRLLVKVVLEDLGHPEYYSTLLKLRLPLWKQIKRNLSPKTTIYINPLYQDQNGTTEN